MNHQILGTNTVRRILMSVIFDDTSKKTSLAGNETQNFMIQLKYSACIELGTKKKF